MKSRLFQTTIALLCLSSLPLIAQAQGNKVNVTLETTAGTIQLELDAAKAPITVANFVHYAKSGFYDDLAFHRVIKGFMIQGGGYDRDYNEKGGKKAPIKNEGANGLKNLRGTVAMARTSDPHSASSQFFINHADNSFLDHPGRDGWGYAVFGKVTAGMDVVDKIAETQTGNIAPFGRDVPVKPILIKSAKVTGE
ncbi:MAG TPA: peptidylprolyl isomerase [Verrucomicrobiae bacterium]|nr:peptidylprolyl isomerase [Verrucomicrobiae bacterium]